MALSLGPDPDADLMALRPLYLEHKERFNTTSWAAQYYEHGVDDRPDPEVVVEVIGCPGCPGL